MPSVLPILQINIDANLPSHPHLKERLDVAPLTWGEDLSQFTKTPVDIVLASDVLYTEESHTPLLNTLIGLSTPATNIIFAYERRRKINDRFFKKATRFFDWTILSATNIIEGADDAVSIYLMKKRDAPLSKRKKESKENKPKETELQEPKEKAEDTNK